MKNRRELMMVGAAFVGSIGAIAQPYKLPYKFQEFPPTEDKSPMGFFTTKNTSTKTWIAGHCSYDVFLTKVKPLEAIFGELIWNEYAKGIPIDYDYYNNSTLFPELRR